MTIIASLIDFNVYKLIHIVGIITLFMGFAYGMKSWSKGAAIAHGIGLLLIIISGFGLISAKYNNNMAPWMFIKLAIWLALGGALVIVKRKLLPDLISWIILLTLATAAAWTVLYGKNILVSI
ncbi:hypothetical protein [Rubritalea profundi]|uniref:Invasion protein n=1 Tax=Rubritalea profundi TaxID=1658618 RepID=A0A2S7U002_9BACT|nr:hypothetical protein [Rubritalea profundi]PQJ28326.1 hypothetical protein BSZ32_07240 [Rubritalea profundi]